VIEFLVPHIESAAALAAVWGPLLIVVLMAIESSVVPLPSEIVMIPAGFLAARHELPPGEPLSAASLAVLCGVLGSLLGAYANYFASLHLGRPLLYRYGRWFFLPPHALERSEEIFREYGDIATFVGRLLPAIRHLISIPAGLSRMNFARFSLWTAVGAGLWCAILTAIGYQLGLRSRELSYAELLERGLALLHDYTAWILLGCALASAAWLYAHRRIMHGRASAPRG
jgi:membrane protein DedA with SNARE-associated domain